VHLKLRQFQDHDLTRLDLSALVHGRFERRYVSVSSLISSQCALGVAVTRRQEQRDGCRLTRR
jgi:hypothetical protein